MPKRLVGMGREADTYGFVGYFHDVDVTTDDIWGMMHDIIGMAILTDTVCLAFLMLL